MIKLSGREGQGGWNMREWRGGVVVDGLVVG